MKRLVLIGVPLALLLAASAHVATAATPTPNGLWPRTPYTYEWPIKPFDQQHPIRGAFGDPRTVNRDQPFGLTGPTQAGAASFHNGVDIVAPHGTPVYPVVSGRVTVAKPDEVVVRTNDGRSFQYFHLSWSKAAQLGRSVVARHTVLGWIRVRYGHVHLSELDHGVIHNPLDPGHLEPYVDTTTPVATGLYLDDGVAPTPLAGRPVGPDDLLSVAASDPPAMPLTGPWAGLPQVPALVQWRLTQGLTRTAWNTVVDFRQTEPPRRDFWQVYDAGTYQNSPTFARHAFLGTEGRYLFRLPLHPERLTPGDYQLGVRVADTSGNRSTTWWPIQIAG